jgi:hypothetical protein
MQNQILGGNKNVNQGGSLSNLGGLTSTLNSLNGNILKLNTTILNLNGILAKNSFNKNNNINNYPQLPFTVNLPQKESAINKQLNAGIKGHNLINHQKTIDLISGIERGLIRNVTSSSLTAAGLTGLYNTASKIGINKTTIENELKLLQKVKYTGNSLNELKKYGASNIATTLGFLNAQKSSYFAKGKIDSINADIAARNANTQPEKKPINPIKNIKQNGGVGASLFKGISYGFMGGLIADYAIESVTRPKMELYKERARNTKDIFEKIELESIADRWEIGGETFKNMVTYGATGAGIGGLVGGVLGVIFGGGQGAYRWYNKDKEALSKLKGYNDELYSHFYNNPIEKPTLTLTDYLDERNFNKGDNDYKRKVLSKRLLQAEFNLSKSNKQAELASWFDGVKITDINAFNSNTRDLLLSTQTIKDEKERTKALQNIEARNTFADNFNKNNLDVINKTGSRDKIIDAIDAIDKQFKLEKENKQRQLTELNSNIDNNILSDERNNLLK